MAQEKFLQKLMPDIIEQWRHYLGLLDIGPGDEILDVGCNVGDTERFIAMAYPYAGMVTGLDKSETRIEEAKKYGCNGNADRIRFVTGDAAALPFEDGHFDRVICAETLEWVGDPGGALGEIYRVLKPGGKALIEHTDFETQVFTSADPSRTRRIVLAFSDSGPRGTIGRNLKALCAEAPFREIKPSVYTLINTEFAENRYSFEAARLIKDWLVQKGIESEADMDDWIDELKAVSHEGRFFYSINRDICLCVK